MSIREGLEQIEQYIIDLIEGRQARSKLDLAIRALLLCLARVYETVVQWRLFLYRHRIFRQRSLGCLVVSIGNVTCGGTGKTPVVEVFSRTLAEKGRSVAVLSRGYRSKSKPLLQKIRDSLFKFDSQPPPPRLVSDGKRLLMNSDMAGDEPYMLASNLPNVAVVVDKDRVNAGKYAIRALECDTLLLDDGFQYLNLKPRLNILLVDSTNPFHNHHLLPRGLLREPITNIRRADYVFLTKSKGNPSLKHLKDFIHKHNPIAEIIECTHRPKHLENVYTGEQSALSTLKGKKLAAISGIACPQSFESFLEELGGELVYSESFVDHHRYREQEIIDFVNASLSKDAELIVTTEKDAVRFPKLNRRDIPLVFLRVEIDILSGQESFDDCISRICFL